MCSYMFICVHICVRHLVKLDHDCELIRHQLCIERKHVVLRGLFELDANVLSNLVRCHVAHVPVCAVCVCVCVFLCVFQCVYVQNSVCVCVCV